MTSIRQLCDPLLPTSQVTLAAPNQSRDTLATWKDVLEGTRHRVTSLAVTHRVDVLTGLCRAEPLLSSQCHDTVSGGDSQDK